MSAKSWTVSSDFYLCCYNFSPGILGPIYMYPDTFMKVYFYVRLQLIYMKMIDVCVYRVST